MKKIKISDANNVKMYQISTLQALAMGHTRSVIDVAELKKHGNTGLGTYEGVNGEMIVVDGQCFRAKDNGSVVPADDDMGVPFASICNFAGSIHFDIKEMCSIEDVKTLLNIKIEELFGLNSMHMVKIDGEFDEIDARSEEEYHAIHVSLKDMLQKTQRSFRFDRLSGTLVCVYYPDFMDGINVSGWHIHFISDDRQKGGHVFELKMTSGHAQLDKISTIEIKLPTDPVFDTYSLKEASDDDIKKVEQGTE
ncbi:MAG: acetolactate decarboxylase [Acutalibacteraceae bacterium]|nr:acetolactate decarboxylase [Acutalibacteraceae bacterium]